MAKAGMIKVEILKRGVRLGSPRIELINGAEKKKIIVIPPIKIDCRMIAFFLITSTKRGLVSKISLIYLAIAVGIPLPIRIITMVVRVTTSPYLP